MMLHYVCQKSDSITLIIFFLVLYGNTYAGYFMKILSFLEVQAIMIHENVEHSFKFFLVATLIYRDLCIL